MTAHGGLLGPCPEPPAWDVDWAALAGEHEALAALAGCPQDPVHHAEGDVGTHTRLTAEALAALPAWRALSAPERAVVFAGAVLHDVGKPDCTRHEGAAGGGFAAGGHDQDLAQRGPAFPRERAQRATEGVVRITSRGHSRRGAILARRLLWRLGVPFATREQACALVRWHMRPFFAVEQDDGPRQVRAISLTCPCDWLALVAEADARGRVCGDLPRLLEAVELFRELARTESCLERPAAFPSDHARFVHFREQGGWIRDAYDDTRGEVVLTSGLPGAGKDRWVAEALPGWPVVSLDALRDELDVDPASDQGAVVQQAQERAREHLRAGRSFVWNATNLSRLVRKQVIDLCAAYRARVRIVYVEVPEPVLRRQNRERARPVPDPVIERLLDRWEVPDLTEAHEVEWVVTPA